MIKKDDSTGTRRCQYKSERHRPGISTGSVAHMPANTMNGPDSGRSGSSSSIFRRGGQHGGSTGRPATWPRLKIESRP